MDLFADEIGMDPAAVRRKNFLPNDAFPYDNPSGLGTAVNGEKVYIDSGNYEPALNKALTMVDYYARLSRAGMVNLHDLELEMVTSDAFLNRLP